MVKSFVPGKPVDNSFPLLKAALRMTLCRALPHPAVLEVYGGCGEMFRLVWSENASRHATTTGDALRWLQNAGPLDDDVFDVDPYGSPFEALAIIGEKASADRIGIAATDGALRRQGAIRGNLPKILEERCGWSSMDKSLMAAIYHRYPAFLRHALACIMPAWTVDRLWVQYGYGGHGKHVMVYFAVVLSRTTLPGRPSGREQASDA